MLSTFFVIVFIYQCIVCVHVKIIPLLCPAKCNCRGTQLLQCKIHSLKEFPRGIATFQIAEVSVKSCNEKELGPINILVRNQMLKIKCRKFISSNNLQHSNCFYSSENMKSRNCEGICLWSAESTCLCFNCLGKIEIPKLLPLSRLIRSAELVARQPKKSGTNDSFSLDSNLSIRNRDEEVKNNSKESNNKTSTSSAISSADDEKNIYFIAIIGSLSILALIINMAVMVNLCFFAKLTVIVLFGTSLTLFNILLSFYGFTMTLYLIHPHWKSNQIFCQGFTSIKLFSLGSGLYAMTFLTLHRRVRNSVDEEREAVFKGIVYILEGVMLAGVFAVLCWIKITEWKYLCTIISPTNSVDWIILGIEVWYYILALILFIWYIVSYFLRKRFEEDGIAYITKDFPIFLMVSLSVLIWSSGYILTLPFFKLFSFKMSGVIRVGTLMLPTILQPVIYSIRDTRLINYFMHKDAKNRCEDVLLVCECTESETCPACDTEYAQTHTSLEDTVFSDIVLPRKQHIGEERQNDITSDDITTTAEDGDKLTGKKKKKRKYKQKKRKLVTSSQTTINPEVEKDGSKNNPDENQPLLKEYQKVRPAEGRQSNISITLESDEDVTQVLLQSQTINEKEILRAVPDPVEGRVSREPSFYPISEHELISAKSESELQSESFDEELNANKLTVEDDSSKSEQKRVNEDKEVLFEKSKHPDDNGELPLHRNSTPSLEWDHSYSYSDSSVSQGSELHSDDMLDEQTSPINLNDNCKENNELTEKDESMEWDHSGSEIKTTPDKKSIELKSFLDYEWKPYDADALLSEKDSAITSGISSSDPTSRQASMDNSSDSSQKHHDSCPLVELCHEDDDGESEYEKDTRNRRLIRKNNEGTIPR